MLIIRFVVAFVIVLALIGLTAWLFRRFAGSGNNAWNRNADNRVEVLETVTVDPKRRLVLLRCDDDEHLILVGGGTDILVSGSAMPSAAAMQDMMAQLSSRNSGNQPQKDRERARPPIDPDLPLGPPSAPPMARQQRPAAREGQLQAVGPMDGGRTLHRADPQFGAPAAQATFEEPGFQQTEFEPDFQEEFQEAVAQAAPPSQPIAPIRPRLAAQGQQPTSLMGGAPQQRAQAAPMRQATAQRQAVQSRPRAALAHDPQMADPIPDAPADEAEFMEDDLTAALAESMGTAEPATARSAPKAAPAASRAALATPTPVRKPAPIAPAVSAAPAAAQPESVPPSAPEAPETAPSATNEAQSEAPAQAEEQASVQNDNATYDDMAKRLEAALKPLDSTFELKSAN